MYRQILSDVIGNTDQQFGKLLVGGGDGKGKVARLWGTVPGYNLHTNNALVILPSKAV